MLLYGRKGIANNRRPSSSESLRSWLKRDKRGEKSRRDSAVTRRMRMTRSNRANANARGKSNSVSAKECRIGSLQENMFEEAAANGSKTENLSRRDFSFSVSLCLAFLFLSFLLAPVVAAWSTGHIRRLLKSSFIFQTSLYLRSLNYTPRFYSLPPSRARAVRIKRARVINDGGASRRARFHSVTVNQNLKIRVDATDTPGARL